MSEPNELLKGGCQCGAVRFELNGPPIEIYVCHCRECQRQSASAFGISVITSQDKLTLIQGKTKKWTRATDSDTMMDCHFCPECGSRLWHMVLDESDPGPALVSVKGGTLDDSVDLSSCKHIWVSRKLDGVIIPDGAPQFHKGSQFQKGSGDSS